MINLIFINNQINDCSVSGSFGQSVTLSVGPSVFSSVDPSVDPSVDRSVCYSISGSVSGSVGLSVGHWVSRFTQRSFSLLIGWLVGWFAGLGLFEAKPPTRPNRQTGQWTGWSTVPMTDGMSDRPLTHRPNNHLFDSSNYDQNNLSFFKTEDRRLRRMMIAVGVKVFMKIGFTFRFSKVKTQTTPFIDMAVRD